MGIQGFAQFPSCFLPLCSQCDVSECTVPFTFWPPRHRSCCFRRRKCPPSQSLPHPQIFLIFPFRTKTPHSIHCTFIPSSKAYSSRVHFVVGFDMVVFPGHCQRLERRECDLLIVVHPPCSGGPQIEMGGGGQTFKHMHAAELSRCHGRKTHGVFV